MLFYLDLSHFALPFLLLLMLLIDQLDVPPVSSGSGHSGQNGQTAEISRLVGRNDDVGSASAWIGQRLLLMLQLFNPGLHSEAIITRKYAPKWPNLYSLEERDQVDDLPDAEEDDERGEHDQYDEDEDGHQSPAQDLVHDDVSRRTKVPPLEIDTFLANSIFLSTLPLSPALGTISPASTSRRQEPARDRLGEGADVGEEGGARLLTARQGTFEPAHVFKIEERAPMKTIFSSKIEKLPMETETTSDCHLSHFFWLLLLLLAFKERSRSSLFAPLFWRFRLPKQIFRRDFREGRVLF